MTIEEAFGAVIRRLRKERDLSQDELSTISSLDRAFISKLECGKQQPTLVTMLELASALNVSVTRMLAETELLLSYNKVRIYRNDLLFTTFEKQWSQSGVKFMSNNPGKSCKETILIVDDEVFLRQFLADLLESEGYNVILAEDGLDAVAKYADNPDHIDLILMDVMMPRKDGVTANKDITALDPHAKILMMSGYNAFNLGDIEKLNFIEKPMFPDMLLANIRNLLDSSNELSLSAN